MTAFYVFVGIVIGMFAVAAWWFAMFSDSDWGEAAREMLDGGVQFRSQHDCSH